MFCNYSAVNQLQASDLMQQDRLLRLLEVGISKAEQAIIRNFLQSDKLIRAQPNYSSGKESKIKN